VLLLDLQNVTVAINLNHCLARCGISPDTPARDSINLTCCLLLLDLQNVTIAINLNHCLLVAASTLTHLQAQNKVLCSLLLLDPQNVTVVINLNHCLARCGTSPDTPAKIPTTPPKAPSEAPSQQTT
jgi:CDGSH-type Zn-finger protein